MLLRKYIELVEGTREDIGLIPRSPEGSRYPGIAENEGGKVSCPKRTFLQWEGI